ncbi:MAG: hypothetical protein VX228_16935, partial [Pseudomonadota bacterium]|nr:hypothetical protein [Pseudomonadota bacterium]
MDDEHRKAAIKELETQAGLLGSAHTFHVQQQRFFDRMQAELASMHRKERQREEGEHALQQKLQQLTTQLNAHKLSSADGGAPSAPKGGEMGGLGQATRTLAPDGGARPAHLANFFLLLGDWDTTRSGPPCAWPGVECADGAEGALRLRIPGPLAPKSLTRVVAGQSN